MKKSIYLIAPLTFLVSCAGTSEIYDDAYNAAKAPALINVDEEGGYADYIKNQEDLYPMQVDSTKSRAMGGNPSYYGNGEQMNEHAGHNHSNYQPGGLYTGYGNQYCPPSQNNYYISYNNACGAPYGWAACPYSCMTYFQRGNCWHTNRNDMWGNNVWNNYHPGIYGQYPGIVYGTNDPYAPNGWYGVGGYDPFAVGYCPNNFGWGGYYGYGYYGNYNPYYANNGYYGGWGSPYDPWGNYYGYGGYGWGGPGFGWGATGNNWGNNNNNWWTNNDNNNSNSGNHHYGPRGGTNTGSYSQNNTNYEHTVKGHEGVTTPFPVYAAGDNELAKTEFSSGKPEVVHSVSNNNFTTTTIDKPDYVNTNTVDDKPGKFGNSKPNNQQYNVISDKGTTYDRPSNNQVVSKGKPANNQFASGGKGSKRTYTTTQKYGRTGGSTTNQSTYSRPDTYYYDTNQNYSNSPTNSGNYSGKTTSNNRRTSSGSTYSGSSSTTNSGTYSRSGGGSGSTYSGSRSSSGSSSRSGGSSGGGSSRRR